MPYDATLDKCLFSKTWENDLGRIVVGVYSYNNGQKKLQFSRETKSDAGEYRFAKLGRLTKEEAQSILPFFQEALTHLD